MAEISSLLTLQGQLALLTLIGFFLARKGIINAQGRKCLTDLLINVILPANIIQSFLVEFSWDVLKSSASILVISLALQIGCVVLCALGYNWLPFARRSVYQYGTVCSNGAFLGSALVDGIWGSSGLLLSSIYLIPQRVAMWSVGVSYFLQDEKPASSAAACSVQPSCSSDTTFSTRIRRINSIMEVFISLRTVWHRVERETFSAAAMLSSVMGRARLLRT